MTTKEYSKRRYEARKASGVCNQCGMPTDRMGVSCSNCKTKARESLKALRERRIAAGLCKACGGNQDRAPNDACSSCKAKVAAWHKLHGPKSYTRLISQRLCATCRKPNDAATTSCTECKSKRKPMHLAYVSKRYSEDVQFRLAHNLRNRTRYALASNQKRGAAIREIGCSIDDLKRHLESQFSDGMTWGNYGNRSGQWNIDHTIPLSSVDLTNPEELARVSHYRNIQPLWHADNIRKGRRTDLQVTQ